MSGSAPLSPTICLKRRMNECATYYAAGRNTVVTNHEAGRTSYLYDDAGRETVIRQPNGTKTSQVYNAADWLTDIIHRTSANSTFESFAYRHDNTGNRTRVIEDSGDIVTWTYDPTYQLTAEHRSGVNAYAHTWTYDATGNRLTEEADGAVATSTYNAANQLLYSVDSLGDRTTYTWGIDDRHSDQEVEVAVHVLHGALGKEIRNADGCSPAEMKSPECKEECRRQAPCMGVKCGHGEQREQWIDSE